jgi:opacity protein-like surface antigen
MMKHVVSGVLALAVIAAAPVAASAQERSPHAGSTAVGIDVGFLVPSDDQLDKTMNVGALFEYYLTPRVSLRTGFGIADSEFQNNEINSLRQVPLRMDLNYNWEGGRWHPFVGTGVGAYFLQQKTDGRPFGDQETKFGFNLGGGAEYFLGRRLAIKGEGRYHFIENASNGLDPSGLSLSVGLKRYF